MPPQPYRSGSASPALPVSSPVPTFGSRTSHRHIETEAELRTLWDSFERITGNDQEKTFLLKTLMQHYEYSVHERDRLREENATLKQVNNIPRPVTNILERSPFVMILIDSDGMVFLDEFLRDGFDGGRRAAAQLHNSVFQYIQNDLETVPPAACSQCPHYKLANRLMGNILVSCRVYANVKGLADVLVRAGIIPNTGHFEAFVRGFNGSGKTLFDFIDVGPGKDRADEKIIASLKFFIDDFHCRQIFFGCSHDNSFARSLEQYMMESAYVSKVTLMEGVPFAKELLTLPYKAHKFHNLFRNTKIGVVGLNDPETLPTAVPFNMDTGLPSRFPPAPNRGGHSRTASSVTWVSGGTTLLSPSLTPAAPANWAEITKRSIASPVQSPPTQPAIPAAVENEAIPRNRMGQRVDPPCRPFDKAEVDRVKKLRLCNTHFLGGGCPKGDMCSHLHEYPITADEKETLRLVARMLPCQHGSLCSDVRCVFGHRCLLPPSRTRFTKRTKKCILHDACKFPGALHDVDTKVVKTVVVR